MGLAKTQWLLRNSVFDPFWRELQKYIDEFPEVDERRHSDILYVPNATSIENLPEIILDRLSKGSVSPSSSWLYMNFCPYCQQHNSVLHQTKLQNYSKKVPRICIIVFLLMAKPLSQVGEDHRNLSLKLYNHVVELLYQEIKHLVHLLTISISTAQFPLSLLKVMFLIM